MEFWSFTLFNTLLIHNLRTEANIDINPLSAVGHYTVHGNLTFL